MWQWKCLICEKQLETYDNGDDTIATWPNVTGGTIEIDFGYGSCFDDQNMLEEQRTQHQACICDNCYKKKQHLTRAVRIHVTKTWEILGRDYRNE